MTQRHDSASSVQGQTAKGKTDEDRIDLGGTKIEGIILDQSGVVLEKVRIPTPGQEYQQILNAITSVVTAAKQGSI